jgi:hypothetical protein
MPKPRNETDGPMDWNDTSHPAVRQAEREERADYENEGADRPEDLDDGYDDQQPGP